MFLSQKPLLYFIQKNTKSMLNQRIHNQRDFLALAEINTWFTQAMNVAANRVASTSSSASISQKTQIISKIKIFSSETTIDGF